MNNFHEIRRKDRILDETGAIDLLQTGEYGFLSLGESANGYAYGIPINYVYDRPANALYFHCAPEGHKLDNLRNNNKVSFCVVGSMKHFGERFTTHYESVIVFGKAGIHLPDDEKRVALQHFVMKYAPEHTETGREYIRQAWEKTFVFKITIEHITAKKRGE
jgi:nitroimidazol reductase NimA-like FMN-containing flavoprotein (pyridoxamine 5'-phosphate oxidase superfamily)